MSIKGAIFDLDGTLTDSMYIWQQAPIDLVRRYGGDPPEDLARDLKEMGRREAAEYLRSRFSLSATPEELMDTLNDLVTEEYRSRVPMKPGADQLLSRLAARDIPCCIATASEAFQAQAAMERLGLCSTSALPSAASSTAARPSRTSIWRPPGGWGPHRRRQWCSRTPSTPPGPLTRRASGSAASGTGPPKRTRRR